jgi:hypothetical protein
VSATLHAVQEAIREHAKRMEALQTMRQRDWETSLAKIRHFKMGILERGKQLEAPSNASKHAPLMSPIEGRKSTLAPIATLAGQKTARSLSIAVPRTPTVVHSPTSLYAGALREVQDEILHAMDSPQDAGLAANGGMAPLPQSPLHVHHRLSHIATAA